MNQETMSQEDVRKLMAGEHVPRRPAARSVSAPNTLTITLPIPPKSTHPNARSAHWRTKAGGVKKQRADSATAACAMLVCERLVPPQWERAEVEATFYLPRRQDSSNLNEWLKATWDGLQDAKIILNDSGLTVLPAKQLTAKAANGERKLVLTIRKQTA